MQSKFNIVIKALEGSNNYDEAIESLADIHKLLEAFTELSEKKHLRRPASRTYDKNMQASMINRVLGYAGKAMHEVTGPAMTKREIIMVADYIVNMQK